MDDRASRTLDTLHTAARGDRWKIARGLPAALIGLARGVDPATSLQPFLTTAFIPVSRDSGRFLYQLALGAQSRHIVEFGTSYGISRRLSDPDRPGRWPARTDGGGSGR